MKKWIHLCHYNEKSATDSNKRSNAADGNKLLSVVFHHYPKWTNAYDDAPLLLVTCPYEQQLNADRTAKGFGAVMGSSGFFFLNTNQNSILLLYGSNAS